MDLFTNTGKKPKKKSRSYSYPHPIVYALALLGVLIIGSVAFAVLQVAHSSGSQPATPGPFQAPTMSVLAANGTSLALRSAAPVALATSPPVILAASPMPALLAGASPSPGVVAAQPTVGVATTLPPSDQDLIAVANAHTHDLGSMRFDFNMTLKASDSRESAQFTVQGTGNFSGVNDFNTVQGQLIVPAGTMTLPDGSTGTFSFEMRLVEGSMYMRTQGSSPSTGCRATRWLQVTLQDMLYSVTLLNPNGGLDLFPGQFDPSDLNLSEADAEAFEGILALLLFGRYVTTTRLPDTGGKATFAYQIDLPGFLQSDNFFTFLGSFGQFGGPAIPADQLKQLQGMAQLFIPQLLQNFGLAAYQEIDIERQLNTGYRLDLETDLRTGALSGDASALPIHLEFDFQVNLSQHGQVFTVEVPPDAMRFSRLPDVLPPEALVPCGAQP